MQSVETFAEDRDLVSVIGVHVDAKRGRLLVCDSENRGEKHYPCHDTTLAWHKEVGELS